MANFYSKSMFDVSNRLYFQFLIQWCHWFSLTFSSSKAIGRNRNRAVIYRPRPRLSETRSYELTTGSGVCPLHFCGATCDKACSKYERAEGVKCTLSRRVRGMRESVEFVRNFKTNVTIIAGPNRAFWVFALVCLNPAQSGCFSQIQATTSIKESTQNGLKL